jgi:hypothetical protein
MAVTTIRGGRQINDGTILYADIQSVGANSVLANATASSAAVTEVALSTNTLLGRGASNIIATTLGTGLSISGSQLQLSTNLTSLSGLTYASASFVKMTAAGTFALDTNNYLTSALTSLNTLTASTQTFANDTNVTITSATSTHTLGWTGQLAVTRGGTGVASVTTTPTATSFAGWDSNKNLFAANFISSYTTTVTSASAVTLTAASTYYQYFTGSTAQTVTLPVATTLSNGFTFNIINQSSAVTTVQTSGANTVVAMSPNSQLIVTCINTAGGTGTASWSWTHGVYSSNTAIARSLVTPASTNTYTPDVSLYDTFVYTIASTAQTITFGVPTGGPVHGQKMIIRIKDNGTGTATISWNAIYRASTDITLPTTTTLGKTQYFGFIYNSTDTKWDLVAKLNNI